MSRFVRPSSYRHVYGERAKKELIHENVRVTQNAWDTNGLSSSALYLSVNWQASGGGAFAIIPHTLTGKLPDLFPLARGHSAPVLDTAWSPFDDRVVASAGDDGNVFVWKVDDAVFARLEANENEGKKGTAAEVEDFAPQARFDASGRKVGYVEFHPTASNVLAAATGDQTVRLFDVGRPGSDSVVTLSGHKDAIQSMSFNSTGTLLATTSRDRRLRLFDPRTPGGPVAETDGHQGIKGQRVCWMGGLDRIATTGFSKMSDRQVFLWDAGKIDGGKPIKTVTLDTSSGVIMPFWSDNNLLFLAGKGDGNIRYYEYENDDLHYLTQYTSSEPQRGMTFLPRRALNTSANEIMRAFKTTKSAVEPVSFIVPRKEQSFQSDIYPPAPASEPALSAADYFAGKNASPKLVNLETGAAAAAAPTPAPAAPSPAPAPARSPSPTPAPAPAPEPTPAPEPERSSTPALAEPAPAPARPPSEPLSFVPEEETPATASVGKSSYGVTGNPSRIAANAIWPPPLTDEEREREEEKKREYKSSYGASATAPAGASGTTTPKEKEQAPVTAPPSPGPHAATPQASNGLAAVDPTANAKLEAELREARARIRELELQVESMKANAKRAADALLGA